METSELTGAALDWAVAKCEGFGDSPRFMGIFMYQQSRGMGYCYSTDWAKGGPIIEREEISVNWANGQWWAHTVNDQDELEQIEYGPTPLIAAMRCYVASKLGDEVELPEELEVTA
jgi:hypothetical protein